MENPCKEKYNYYSWKDVKQYNLQPDILFMA